jgi:hypothetical protein
MVTSLISGGDCSVTGLGRNIDSQTTEKHQIKRSMRLCSNPHLQSDITVIYSRMAERLIGLQKRPIILVDWSDLDPRKQHFLFRASVAVDGRSLTIFEKIYPLSQKEKPRIHKQFMILLKSMLPPSCKPIIVSDAGFRVPWFELIESLGWDFVGRVRNRTHCQLNQADEWRFTKSLYSQASHQAKPLGEHHLRRQDPISCYLRQSQRTTPSDRNG